jgi:RHS repeat-associated protein
LPGETTARLATASVAGTGEAGDSGDGGPATDAQIAPRYSNSNLIAVAPDGSIIFADGRNGRIRRVDQNGIINTIAGRACAKVPPSFTTCSTMTVEYNGLALATDLSLPDMLTLSPDGTVHFVPSTNANAGRIDSILPKAAAAGAELEVVDGGVIHVFSAEGRHLRTRNADTGAELVHFDYNAAGLLVAITDLDGNVTAIERNSSGDATAVIAPGGQRTELSIAGTLSSITTAPGETTSFTYFADGLLRTMRDARGNETTFRFDALGLLTHDADPEGGAKDLARIDTAEGHMTTVTTVGGKTRRYETELAATGEETTRFIDGAGLVTTKLLKKDGTTITTMPDGTTTMTRSAADPVFSMQSPFTGSGNLVLPSGKTLTLAATSTAVTAAGDPRSATSRTERTTIGSRTFTRVFDRAALTETITSPLSRTMTMRLDGAARLRRVTVPTLAAIDLSYGSTGQLASVTQGTRSVTYTYTPKRELETVQDSLGRTTRFEYDPAGRVRKQVLPDLREIGFSYDLNGNLTSVTPPSRPQHTFDYNMVNLAAHYVPPAVPGGGVTHYIYNKDRELTTIERPDGATINLDYDGGGRLQSLIWPSGSLTYGYLGTGNLGSISGADASLSYTYDGSLVTSAAWSGAVSGTIAWTYNADLDVSSEAVNGDAVAFTYDGDGLVTDVGPLHLYRNAAGIADATSLGVSTDQFVLNTNGEATDYTAAHGAAQILSLHYTRDGAGRITGITEHSPEGDTFVGYSYDAAGRLQDAFYPSVNIHYDYDANGNRIARHTITTGGTTTETAAYDAQDRLTNYEGTQYTYTPNGELLTKSDSSGTTTYDYDALGNLRHVTLPGGTAIDYLIDAQNRRVGKKVNGTLVSDWLYGDQLRIVAELDGKGTIVSRFVYGSRSNIPDFMIRGGVTYRIISDHLGSPRFVINTASGMIVAKMQYDEFGTVVSETNAGFIPFGFAGGLYEHQTRLVRFGARDYDPRTARWTAKDPLLWGGSTGNLYSYVLNNPVNLLDPWGLADVSVQYYPGVIPHLDLRIDGQPEQGFFPATPQDARSTYSRVPSAVHGEDADPGLTVTFSISPEQAAQINDYIRRHRSSGYSLLTHNCAQYTQEALRAGDVRGTAPKLVINPLSTVLWDLAFIPGARITQSAPGDTFARADNAARSLLSGGFGR